MASKVLVLGSPRGRLAEAFAKVAALQAKQHFALCLITGDLFSDDADDDAAVRALLSGAIDVPLPTYFTLGLSPLPAAVRQHLSSDSSGQLCENLFFLGRKGALKTSEGIKIVYLGGALDPAIAASAAAAGEPDPYAPLYSASDAAGLRGQNSADILLTAQFPANFAAASKLPAPDAPSATSQPLAELARVLRPRYHFVAAAADRFYEREPYRNPLKAGESAGDTRYTRLIGVAAFGNAAKQKALYAFSLDPSQPPPPPPSAATTPCPYAGVVADEKRKRKAESQGANFIWGDGHGHEDGGPKRRRGGGRGGRGGGAPRPPPGPDSCFFCLSYPQLEKHLITSIGEEAYVTTAKGPLTSEATNPDTLPYSAHLLIIPLTHAPTLSAIEDEAVKASTKAEMTRYRDAVANMFDQAGCVAVGWEIARRAGVHAHWQVLPVPKEKAGEVMATFEAAVKGDADGELEDVREGGGQEAGDFFRIWISGSGEGESAKTPVQKILRLEADGYFDLQFPRRVLVDLLGLDRARNYWKNCVMSRADEAKDASAFKAAFQPFDFSLG